jgi:hypothetical protein
MATACGNPVVHRAEVAGVSLFGVYEWGSLHFSSDECYILLEGLFASSKEAASSVSQLSLAEFADTWGVIFELHSTLPAKQALSLIAQLISQGETIFLNGFNYRRESSGYVKA